MQSQATSRILMIRPVHFGFNPETAESNAFQDVKLAAQTKDVAQEDARREFDEMVRQLQAIGVDVMVYDDTVDPYTPDSIFPNNWVSFHASGRKISGGYREYGSGSNEPGSFCQSVAPDPS
jgi:hypothetical protein